MSIRPFERIRFSRVYTCSWCICHGILHKMIEISLNRHRSFLVPQNTDKFHHDEILFPVFVLIHHIQSLLDCQTWLAFFPYLIRFYQSATSIWRVIFYFVFQDIALKTFFWSEPSFDQLSLIFAHNFYIKVLFIWDLYSVISLIL